MTKQIGSGRGERELKVRVKDKKKTPSQKAWLQRQLNDPYVARARREGFRSRAAFKLIEIDDKHHILKRGAKVVDLGAAPGGWSQVAAKRIGEKGHIVGIDLLEMDEIPGVTFAQIDFLAPDAPNRLKEMMGGPADVVLSDMAANATGHRQTDHINIMALAEAGYEFAKEVLKPGGTYLAKVLRGGTEGDMLKMMKKDFASVRHVKPMASRDDSAELFVLAMGFRGGA